jgi:hypothetical protein
MITKISRKICFVKLPEKFARTKEESIFNERDLCLFI